MESSSAVTRGRKRTAHACDSCRLRKSRCDGRRPCTNCRNNGLECLYGELTPLSYSKSDLILRTVLKMDGMLQTMREEFNSRQAPNEQFVTSPVKERGESSAVANATIPSSHLSATENLLSTPLASTFPSLTENFLPIFQLESRRSPIVFRHSLVHPMLRPAEAERLFGSFSSSWNFWYPVISHNTLQSLLRIAQSNSYDQTSLSCATLLVLALGSAAELVPRDYPGMYEHQDEARSISDVCFDSALKLMPMVQMQFTTLSTQCNFLSGLYCLFLQRPLQAWTYLHPAAARSRTQMLYNQGSASHEEDESIHRMFWSCYILESDLVAELSQLPQSGIAEVESEVRLPGPLKTHASEHENENSALYFLACISMRRLLNRVHNLLYSNPQHQALHAQSPGSADSGRDQPFSRLVYELDHQLQRWHNSLPEYLRFENETAPVDNEHQGFLRQRYLTCKHIIYRSFLEYVMENEVMSPSQETIESCRKCLEATCLHIANLRSFAHTVMVDTWICSLSMTSAMFLLLTSLKYPPLRSLALDQLPSYGTHLIALLSSWISITPQESPSVRQSIDLIREIDRLIHGNIALSENV